MSLNLGKTSAEVPLSLDLLKLIDLTANDVINCVSASFYSNGNIADTAARNLKTIHGQMTALRNMLKSIE